MKIGSGATPKGGESVYLANRENFVLIRSQNVFDRYFNPDGLALISDEHAAQLQSVSLQQGDILLNITGDGVTFGRSCLVPTEILPACVNQHVVIIRPDQSVSSPGYILAYLTHPLIKKYMESFNAGGSRRALTKGHIESFQIPLPPLPLQRRIADILGALDDKIEVNRRISATLETMARALFKHWFVDFGPFRDGPFVETEIGSTPKGWRIGYLSEVAQAAKKGVDPQDLEADTPYIGLADMPQGSISLEMWGEAGDSISGKNLMRKGQILFGRLRPYFKKVGVAPVDGVCSTDILVITAKQQKYFSLVLCQLVQQKFIDYASAVSDGTRMPRVSWHMMAKYRLILPPPEVVQRFNNLVEPWIMAIIDNISESRSLAATRDYLLPRLLSGEIAVDIAEAMADSPELIDELTREPATKA